MSEVSYQIVSCIKNEVVHTSIEVLTCTYVLLGTYFYIGVGTVHTFPFHWESSGMYCTYEVRKVIHMFL